MTHPELFALWKADQEAHKQPPLFDTLASTAMRHRNAERRQRVQQIVTTTPSLEPADFYYAALVLHHSGGLDEVWHGHELARRSAETGYRPARWLVAATFDRWLMYQGRPQKYGTQIVPDGRRFRVWDVDPETTDADRIAWDVRPLVQQHHRAAQLTRTEPMPPMDRAPSWLKIAIDHWRSSEN
jgi:hypothetical protein